MPPSPVVVGLGELLWDIFPEGRHAGGAPANVAYHASQLGCTGVVASRVGTDLLGTELVQYLARMGLPTDHVQHDSDRPTGTVTAKTNDSGGVDYVIHEGVAWDHLATEDSLLDLMRRSAAVCFGSLAQRGPVSRETIRAAVSAVHPDTLRVYDVNLRQTYYDHDVVSWSLGHANIVKLNHEEVPIVLRLLGEPAGREGRPFLETARSAHDFFEREFGIGKTIITRAAEGCILLSRDETVEVPGQRIEKPDPVGAGDAFTAAFIAASLWGWPLSAIGPFANAVGTLVAGLPGAMPEVADRYAALIKQYQPAR